MQGTKTWGWVLLVVGVLGALWAFMQAWGMLWIVILIVIALVGAWMAFSGGGSQQSM